MGWWVRAERKKAGTKKWDVLLKGELFLLALLLLHLLVHVAPHERLSPTDTGTRTQQPPWCKSEQCN